MGRLCRLEEQTSLERLPWRHACCLLFVEILENLAYLANASNLVLYLLKNMNFSPSRSANTVTDFMGTAFLLATSWRILIGCVLYNMQHFPYKCYDRTCGKNGTQVSSFILQIFIFKFWGLATLTVQAHLSCGQTSDNKEVMLFVGLYLVALGVGGIKGSLPAHGAEQFDANTQQGRKKRSTFFNYFVFCLSCGALVAVTLVVWIEDSKGFAWGFGISAITILFSIPIFLAGSHTYKNKTPTGSALTTIFKVLAAALLNRCSSRSSSTLAVSTAMSPRKQIQTTDGGDNEKATAKLPETLTEGLEFLHIAIAETPIHPSLDCSVTQVEEVKIVFRILPIFASTFMLNCCLAQLSTFSVQQAATMNTKLGSFMIPPASLPIFPILITMILAPIYDHLIIPFLRRVTKTEMGISHLQGIGFGLILSIIAMAVAAMVENKRKMIAIQSNLIDSPEALPITFLWVALQYLFLGSADLFTLAGLLEFFFTQAPASMRSLAMALSWASLAMGYYLSSFLVSAVNRITASLNNQPWLSGRNLNHYQLDKFYWLVCVLSGLNFLQFIFWANQYKYKPVTSPSLA
ncbi:hypothetical protein C5167_006014 [Papaver somniferum]|uniref:Uncharacterized protein n=1 Tax=Papaver somniferum TaxID=3469 RepID=A0A4Y7JD19_PAPSO|nr:hypothetical protein C5167_006014 [Papaver somniferum]